MAEMNKEEWRVYNRQKQAEYRLKKRGEPRKYIKTEAFFHRSISIEVIMKEAGHCGFCGILLSNEWHDKHPLVGCERYIKEYHNTHKRES